MDDYNKPSRRKPAKTSLPSALEKEAMTTSLNSKLPKSIQRAPLDPAKVFVPSVEDMGTPAPSFDASSNVAASNAAYPDYGSNKLTRYNSSQVDDREHHARAEFRYQHATRRPMLVPRYMDAYSAPCTATHMHTAKAFVRHLKRPRERAKRRQRLTAWSASSTASGASFCRFSVRVSLFSIFR
jgi:hypothetical protein